MSGATPILLIVRELETLANAHGQVKTFKYGQFLDVIKDTTIDYALCHANIRSANKNENSNVIQIELSLMDKTRGDDSNLFDVESNTYQIFIDLFNIISYSPRWQTLGVVNSSSAPQKFLNRGADVVTGWGAVIQFEIYEGLGFCDVPVYGYDYDAPIQTLPGATYKNSDDTFLQEIAAGSTFVSSDITVTDSDGSTFTSPTNKNITCTPSVVGTIYNRPTPPWGNMTSGYTYDEGWQYQNGTYTTGYAQSPGTVQELDNTDLSRLTLKYNNSFGNLNRYTSENGDQVFNNLVCDNLHGLMFRRDPVNEEWSTGLTTAATTTYEGYSDWRVVSIPEINTIVSANTYPLNYSPFFAWSTKIPHTCSLRNTTTSQHIRYSVAQLTSLVGNTGVVNLLWVRTM